MGCHRVIAVSQALRRFLVQDVQVPNTKVQTIYNGIDVEQFSSKTPREQFRQSLGIPSEARVIGTVGSLYPVKGQTHLLQAMAQVVKRVPTAVCLIVGRGELLSTLQQQANELQLGERVKFLGFRSDVAELLSLMEVFILPSLSEGLPLSLLEAQAAGKPVVASRVGGNPEVVENGKTGFLVPPSEPDMLAERIVQLLENPSAAIAMGERGRLRMRQIFSLEAMGRAYLSLFMSYMNGSAAYRKTWVD
jgi:glycosyltransferase involved in cell wall biosynthesis